MNTLDQLIAAEKEATVGLWHTISLPTQTQVRGPNDARVATRCYSADAALIALLRNHAAELLVVARAAQKSKCADVRKAVAPLLTTEEGA